MAMWSRRVFVVLTLIAYVGASVLLPAAAPAMAGDLTKGMAQHQEAPSDKMPCKHSAPTCITDLGCVFLVGLPTLPDPTLLTLTAWSSVSYPGSPDALQGRSVKPAIGPPMRHANQAPGRAAIADVLHRRLQTHRAVYHRATNRNLRRDSRCA
jgi:hypothetical protein